MTIPVNLFQKEKDVTSMSLGSLKQITTAGATTAAVTEKVWGEYVSVVCQITKMKETSAKEFKISFQFSFSQPNGFAQRTMAVIRFPRTKRLFLSESEYHTLCI